MNEAAFNIMKKTKIILVKYHIISIYYHNSTFGTLDNSKLVVFGIRFCQGPDIKIIRSNRFQYKVLKAVMISENILDVVLYKRK